MHERRRRGDATGARPARGSDVEIWDDVPADADTLDALCLAARLRVGARRAVRPSRQLRLVAHPAADAHSRGCCSIGRTAAPAWQYFANRRFQHLISGKRRRFPKLKIQSTGIDWFSVKAEWEDETVAMTEADWARLHQSDDPYIKLSNGTWMEREEATAMAEAVTALAEIGVQVGAGEQQVGALADVGRAADRVEKARDARRRRDRRRVIQQLRQAVTDFQGVPEIAEPKGLRAELRPYQKTGLHFLAYASTFGLGALLADDMGLGKTVQALAWLQHLREEKGPRPSLVICPASVVFNWQREAEQFMPGMKVLLLTAGEHRHTLRQEIPAHDLVVTNYALLRRDLAALQKFSFRAIILDEAQNIKNPESMVARAAKALKADHKLALTGTPLENRLLDLVEHHGIRPSRLPARPRQVPRAIRPRRLAARARAALQPHAARSCCAGSKSRSRRTCPTASRSGSTASSPRASANSISPNCSAAARRFPRSIPPAGQSRMHVLAALTRLRQICCHPDARRRQEDARLGQDRLALRGARAALRRRPQGARLLAVRRDAQDPQDASSRSAAGPTSCSPARRPSAAKWCRRSTTARSRRSSCSRSRRRAPDSISPRASYVVLYDPWWNPAVEAQAIDRTHRIGQDRTVIAYRLVTQGTVEEKIWRLQQSKAQLAQDVLGEEGFTGSLSKTDFDYLLEDTSDELESPPEG